jgi:surfactin synthase thioesterase subunit
LLFCIPHAGGDAGVFRNWQKSLEGVAHCVAIDLPGRGPRINESPYLSMEPLVRDLAEQIKLFLIAPFAVFGHSMGALIAFELVRQLRRVGVGSPALLIVAGHEAPHRMQPPHVRYSRLDDARLKAVLQRDNPTLELVLDHREMTEIFLPLLRADYRICDDYAYVPEAPLTCPLFAIGGSEDRVSRADLDAWRLHTLGHSEVKVVIGDHFFITSRPDLVRDAVRRMTGVSQKVVS